MFWSERELGYAEAPLLATASWGGEKQIQEASGLGSNLASLCTGSPTSL